MNNILKNLAHLGLDQNQAAIYLELLREPSTHLRLSHVTGINRTKVYRIIEDLEKKSLVARRTDDTGTFLVASEPSALEIALVNQETKLKQQRASLTQLLPQLESFLSSDTHDFVVRTYEGLEGFKQMIWNELETKGELLGLGGQTIENLIGDHRWAEKFRSLAVESGFSLREILNQGTETMPFTSNQEYMKRYRYREIHDKNIFFNEQIIIYNDTVCIYHWRENKKVGIEIVSKSYAEMMRQMFEHFWSLAKPQSSSSYSNGN